MNHILEAENQRRSPTQRVTQFTRSDGQLVSCQVTDMSPGYVNVNSETRPALGEFVLISQLVGKVVLRYESGIGIRLIDGPADVCGRSDS